MAEFDTYIPIRFSFFDQMKIGFGEVYQTTKILADSEEDITNTLRGLIADKADTSYVDQKIDDNINYVDQKISTLAGQFPQKTFTNQTITGLRRTSNSNVTEIQKGYATINYVNASSTTATTITTVGLNQWDEQYESGRYDNDTGANVKDNTAYRTINPIKVLPNTQYYFTRNNNKSSNYRIYYYNKYDGYIVNSDVLTSNYIFTTPEECHYIRFWDTGTEYNYDICLHIYDENIDNDVYEPYWKETTEINKIGKTIYRIDPLGTEEVNGTLVADINYPASNDLNKIKLTFAEQFPQKTFTNQTITNLRRTNNGNYTEIQKGYAVIDHVNVNSTTATTITTVGFNQWDEQWIRGSYNEQGVLKPSAISNRISCLNLIPVIPGVQYRFEYPYVGVDRITCFYDEHKTFIRRTTGQLHDITLDEGTYYVGLSIGSGTTPVTQYENNMCFHIRGDGSRNGQYEPYWKEIITINKEDKTVYRMDPWGTEKVNGTEANSTLTADINYPARINISEIERRLAEIEAKINTNIS